MLGGEEGDGRPAGAKKREREREEAFKASLIHSISEISYRFFSF